MIIRTIFWLSLVIMLVPVKVDPRHPETSTYTSLQAILVAKSFVGDISGFCARNPESCATTRKIISEFSARARAHARQLAQALKSEDRPIPTDNILTGSIRSRE